MSTQPMNNMMNNNQPYNFMPQQIPMMPPMYGMGMQQQMGMQQMGMQQMGMQQMSNRSSNMPTIYVGDLEEQITEEMLHNFFIKYGQIYSVRVMREQQSGSEMKKSRGFAFVSFYHQKDAENARLQANHEPILQNPIRVGFKKYMKDINTDCNVYVKNIDTSVTNKEFEQFFSQFGNIFSSKIPLNEGGENRGYGYIQFDQKESVAKCLKEANGLMLKDKKVEVEIFRKKNDRTQVRKNIYIRNLPALAQAELESKLTNICSQYGEVGSLLVREHKEKGKSFAFVCYVEQDAAENAFIKLQDQDPFNINEKLYVNWAEKKNDRSRRLKEINAKYNTETNIYTKQLKPDVTSEQLKAAYEIFGEVTSCIVKCPPPNKKAQDEQAQVQIDTQFGYINYKDKDFAKKALTNAKNEPSIRQLYVNDSLYINFHLNKEQFQQFKSTKSRQRQNQNMMNQMNYQRNMGQMPMNMMMNPYMNMNPYMMNQQFSMMNRNNYGVMPMRGMANRGQFRGRGNMRGGMQQRPQRNNTNVMNVQQSQNAGQRPQTQVGQQPATQQTQFHTIQQLKDNLSEFMKLEVEKQRMILGEMLFPLIQKMNTNELAPKITGMLIDFDVFEVSDIVEMLDSQEQLQERVKEAVELINNPGNE